MWVPCAPGLSVLLAFDPALDRYRKFVECGFNRLEHWRGVSTRYDKYATTYLGGVLGGSPQSEDILNTGS